MNMFAVEGLPESDLGAWIAPRLGLTFGAVARHVPAGFERYIRVFHPADPGGGESTTWASVADAHGTVMHATAQFHALIGRDHCGTVDVEPPRLGALALPELERLTSILRRHTPSDDCVFAYWEGWNALARPTRITAYRDGEPSVHTPTPLPDQAVTPPPIGRLSLPHRNYALFRGGIDVAVRFGSWATEHWLIVQSPNLFWAADHSWCVATEVDFDSTLVGGSAQLIADIQESADLESGEVQPTDELHSEADQRNQ
jgi:hypothetical protein